MSSKCKSCGYHKNPPGATHCNLCGQGLDSGGEHVNPVGTMRFGKGKDLRRAVAEEKKPNRPADDQIVYAGDFAIVYAFVPVKGGMIVLKPGEVFTFGRGDQADYKIDAKVVSRRHARVHWSGVDPPVPEIVDLESKNGIRVNSVPISRRILEDGDEVQIGPFVATLRVLSANDDLDNQVGVDRLGATMVSGERLWGEVRLVPVPWLLGHLERIKESGTLFVHTGDTIGSVTLISGVAISASCNEANGEEAIRAVLRLRDGRLTFSPRADAPPQSIGKTLAELIAQEGGGVSSGLGRPPAQRPAAPPPRRPPPPQRGAARPRGGPPRRPPPIR